MSVNSLLELRCLLVLGEFADRLDPNIFSGIPRHVLVEISKCLNPFDLERLESAQVFEKAGISTGSLWKERYHRRWIFRPFSRKVADYRKLHTPEDILQEECGDCDSWRAAYLGRHLQEVLNERQNVTDWVHRDIRELHLSPLLNHNAYQRIWSLENTLDNCSRYATCLTLSNRACIYLAENPSVFLRFADYVKFLRVNFVQKSGIAPLCSLLETLTSKNLIGLEFCKCRHVDPQSWSKIFNARLPDSKSKQLSSWQQWPVIQSKTLSTTCSCQDFVATTCTKSCKTSSDTGHLHSCCTSSQIRVSSQGRGSTSTGRSHTSFCRDSTIPSSEEREFSLDVDKQVKRDSLDVYCKCDDTDEEADSDSLQDIHLYDFDADMEMCADRIPSHSKMSESSSCRNEQKVSDLYDEVFACSRVTEGRSREFLCRSALDTHTSTSGRVTQSGNRNAQMCTMETLPRTNMYTGTCRADTNSPFSCLRHLEYGSDCVDPTGSSLTLILKMLKNCHSLESLIVAFSQPCKGAEALVNAVLDLCSKGKLRYLELHDLHVLSLTDNLIKILCQVVGAYCTVCQLHVPASLKSLRLLGNPSISAQAVGHFAKRLANVCLCLSKEESGKDQARLVCSAQMGKVPQATLENPSVYGAGSVLVFENSEDQEGRDELLKGMSGKQNTSVSGCGDDAADLTGRHVLSPVDVHVKQNVEAAMRFTGLQELELSCWHIGDNGAKAIAASLERNSTLICLALPSCDISTPGMSAIFRAVTGNRTLKTLNLSMNCYSPLADNSLAAMLRTSQGLSQLDMSHCFSDEGLTQEVIFSLCQNNSLKCLKLNENRLGDSGLEMLAEVFRKPETESRITRLELSSNLVTSSSVMTLVTALHSFKPRKLEELVLAGNYFGSNINKARACLQCVVDSVYVSNEDSTLSCADYVSQM